MEPVDRCRELADDRLARRRRRVSHAIGAAAAIYYGERFYQLPVGILGTAIATVIYPLLSRHAICAAIITASAADLTLGLRLVWLTGFACRVGIMLVAEPLLARVLFEHGEFTAADAARSARMIACYASGVWAYLAIPVLVVAGFYAVGDRTTPAKLGVIAGTLNLTLNLTLVWPLAEAAWPLLRRSPPECKSFCWQCLSCAGRVPWRGPH